MKDLHRDQAEAVQRMQDWIEAHLSQEITLEDLASSAGYSAWHASRLFHQVVGIHAMDYIRSRRMAAAAQMLRDSGRGVLDTALKAGFGSHEGFTRAFRREFGLSPSAYASRPLPLPWLMARSALAWHLSKETPDSVTHSASSAVFVRLVENPPRRLVLFRGRQAEEYWSYCEEVGCDAWGLLASMPGALSEPKGFWLPDTLRPAGTSLYVMGVEMPEGWEGALPEKAETLDLPASQDLVFQGQPYQEPEMGAAISALRASMDAFNPSPLGLAWAPDSLPSWQMAPLGSRGVIEARPVRPSTP